MADLTDEQLDEIVAEIIQEGRRRLSAMRPGYDFDDLRSANVELAIPVARRVADQLTGPDLGAEVERLGAEVERLRALIHTPQTDADRRVAGAKP